MGKHGGFNGMGMNMNMNQLMRQAQQMQKKMEEQQAALEQQEFSASAGGGAVSVTMNGKRELLNVKLSAEVVDPDDIEMLQDLIVAAVNEATKQIDAASNNNMQSLTGGMGGLF